MFSDLFLPLENLSGLAFALVYSLLSQTVVKACVLSYCFNLHLLTCLVNNVISQVKTIAIV